MRTACSFFGVLTILSAFAVGPAMAKDDPLEFLHLLQREGYPDVAIDYLDQFKADQNTPKEIMDVWGLEMSRSKKEAVRLRLAYSDAQAKQWADESKALLEQFIKDNPTRPEAIQEAARWSEEQALQAQSDVIRAGYVSDPAEKAKLLAGARNTFQEIRPRFVEAEKASAGALAALPRTAPRARRESAAALVGENRLTVAMVDFYLAQTLATATERAAELTRLIKVFDGIYQTYREAQTAREAFLGWRAHFWNGRIFQELGQFADARAIYEEVAACDERNIEEVGDNRVAVRARSARKTGLEDFFAEVEQYYLQTLFQLSKKEYLDEVKAWRAVHKANSENCHGYQALTLEYAKNLVDIGNQSKDETTKKRALSQAIQALIEMGKVASPYKEDAVKLRRQLNPKGSQEEGFEDAVINGDAALEKKNWAAAAESYERAVAAASAKTDKQRLAIVENLVVACFHNLALQHYQKGKIDEAIATAKKGLKREYLQTKAAPGVAVFLLNVQYYQYLAATEGSEAEKKAKSELLAKVTATASSILNVKQWAAKEEGDSARIILLRLARDQNNTAEADKVLKEINPNSKEYPKALNVMGFDHWRRYKIAKRQIDSDQASNKSVGKDAIARRDDDRKQALEYADKAVKAMDTPRAADAAIPEALRETMLLLAEIHSEGKDYKLAISQYKPLVDDLLRDSTKPFDDTALRILDGASEAYLQLGDMANAAKVGGKLVESAPDDGQVNIRLLSFTRGLDSKRKDVMAEGDSGDFSGQGIGTSKLKVLTDLQEKFMINLSKREKLTPASMIWIVKTSSNLGTDDSKATAANLIEKIVDRSKEDQAFNEQVKKALPQLQSLGAILNAQSGNYDKATTLIGELRQIYPRALEPRVSEAKILTEWAAKDTSKYDDAIAAWDNLRRILERASNAEAKGGTAKKGSARSAAALDPKYEVILNEADCFFKLSQKNKSKDLAKRGMELLIPYVNFDPKIQNPSEEYKEISFRYYQLSGRIADFLGVARPVRPKTKRT
jgi:hypothetical protein